MTINRATLLTIAAWLAAAACAGWAAARLTGLERGWPAIQVMAFAPYAAVAAGLAAAAVLALRRWVPGTLAVVAAVALAAVLVPRATADGAALPTGPTLRLLTANLLLGGADVRTILAEARRLRVDVLALQEYTPGAADRLDAAGVAALFPYRAAYPEDGTAGSALYSRYPLTGTGVRVHPNGWHFKQAQATVTVPGAPPVLLESVHPTAPSDASLVDDWAADLRDQPPATPHGPLRVLLGDFNATLDHAALRRLIATGYRDAADVSGTGLRTTWPYDERWYLPGVTLDRVLADRRIGARTTRPYRTPDSDHKAFYAELVLPSG